MTNPNDDIPFEDIFEIEPVKPSEITVYDAPSDNADSYDLEASRQNIHHLIQKGTVALDELISVARQSQSVAGFEAVTKMLTALSNINKDLIVVQEKKKQMKIADDKKTMPEKIVQNNYTVTTEEFAKIIEEKESKGEL